MFHSLVSLFTTTPGTTPDTVVQKLWKSEYEDFSHFCPVFEIWDSEVLTIFPASKNQMGNSRKILLPPFLCIQIYLAFSPILYRFIAQQLFAHNNIGSYTWMRFTELLRSSFVWYKRWTSSNIQYRLKELPFNIDVNCTLSHSACTTATKYTGYFLSFFTKKMRSSNFKF